jgi:hypothetical protein
MTVVQPILHLGRKVVEERAIITLVTRVYSLNQSNCYTGVEITLEEEMRED